MIDVKKLKDDLDRLHRERDSFQEQARVLAESVNELTDEVSNLMDDSKRLNFLITRGTLHNDFDGNFYVTCLVKRTFKTFDGGSDALKAIDAAIEAANE